MSNSALDKREVDRYLKKLKQIGESGHVNYAETEAMREARIKKASKDWDCYVGYYFPHYAESKCADFQIEAAYDALKNKNYTALEIWARGLSKSVTFGIFLPIWLHLFHKQLWCMLLVSKNLDAAKRLLSDVQAEFEANPQLRHDFGNLVSQGDWAEGNFYTTTGAAFFALGKGQSPRGIRNGPHRPDYIDVDDADDDEECRNPMRIQQSVDWILRALIPSMGNEITRFVMVNNLISKNSIMAKLSENPEFKIRRVNAIKENGEPAWDRYTKEFYQNRLKVIGWAAFQTEYMNEPHTEGKIFTDDYIQYKPRLKFRQYERIVGVWDIAYSEKKTADCNAIPIVGLYGTEKHIIKSYCRNSTMETALRWMYQYHLALPKGIEIEWYAESQFWNTAVDLAMQQVAKEFGFRLPIIFLDRPTTNKYSRIIQMLPPWQRLEIYVSEEEKHNLDMQHGIEQMKGIEPGYRTHDDWPDALNEAINKLEVTREMEDYEPQIGARHKPRNLY